MSEPSAPYRINPSAIAAQAPVLLRQVVLVIGGALTIVGFLGKRDLAGLWGYLQSDGFVPVFSALAAGGALVWGQWKAHRDRVRLVAIGNAAPDSVAVVTAPAPPPAVSADPDGATL